MRQKVQERQEAIRLRKMGYSYSEILVRLPVGKGTLSGWLRGVELSEGAMQRLKDKAYQGRERSRMASMMAKRRKQMEQDENIRLDAAEKFYSFVREPLFQVGLTLYWAEGTKNIVTLAL